MNNRDIFGAFRAASKFTTPRTSDEQEALFDRILQNEESMCDVRTHPRVDP